MRVLVLLSRVPYPLEKGDKLRAYHQVKELAKNHEIILCCLNDSELHPEALKMLNPFCKRIEIINISKVAILLNLASGLFSNKPFQVHYFYHKKAQKTIDHLIETEVPKHIFCQLIRVSEYVKKYTILPKTLDFMDAFSQGINRRVQNAPFYLKPFLYLEAKRLKSYEKAIFSSFEHRTIISKQDRNLIDHHQNTRIQVVPNGVDEKFFDELSAETDFDLVFTGNMNYPPNIEAACYLVNKIMPIVWNKRPKTNVLLSGATPSAKVKALSSKKVSVTGWVDDIRESYSRSKIFVAPMQIGTGLQNKLLEAMAMKMPCITSELANNALEAIPNTQVLIGKNQYEYADHILNLLNDPKEQSILAKAGYDYVRTTFNWKTTTHIIDKLITGTL